MSLEERLNLAYQITRSNLLCSQLFNEMNKLLVYLRLLRELELDLVRVCKRILQRKLGAPAIEQMTLPHERRVRGHAKRCIGCRRT